MTPRPPKRSDLRLALDVSKYIERGLRSHFKPSVAFACALALATLGLAAFFAWHYLADTFHEETPAIEEEYSAPDTDQTLTVIRIEGNYAVCETLSGELVDVPLKNLPSDIAEGDKLRRVNEASGTYTLDTTQP
ncbi:MAG: DUF3006 domain-containing protein [Coriobacteriia bacterium]|nr:DUF3006 domain-containing protein [Coriobacteriia bacterium]